MLFRARLAASPLFPILVSLCLCVACDDGDDDDDDDAADSGEEDADDDDDGDDGYAAVQAIWDANCVDACHEPGGEWSSLDLSASDSDENLIDAPSLQGASVPLVTAGSTEDSYLWHKLNGTQGDVGGSGVDMPKGSDMLSGADLATIEAWIEG